MVRELTVHLKGMLTLKGLKTTAVCTQIVLLYLCLSNNCGKVMMIVAGEVCGIRSEVTGQKQIREMKALVCPST